ncbi:MAG: hypothetical protein WC584_02915 [Candidatus Pacearchaeota archaeon]
MGRLLDPNNPDDMEKLMNLSIAYDLKDDDYILVPRFPGLRGKPVTKREYEQRRQRILSTPLP